MKKVKPANLALGDLVNNLARARVYEAVLTIMLTIYETLDRVKECRSGIVEEPEFHSQMLRLHVVLLKEPELVMWTLSELRLLDIRRAERFANNAINKVESLACIVGGMLNGKERESAPVDVDKFEEFRRMAKQILEHTGHRARAKRANELHAVDKGLRELCRFLKHQKTAF